MADESDRRIGIRAVMQPDGSAAVKLLLRHPMETGLRKDAQERLIPAWFIHTVAVHHRGREALRMHCGPSTARDPFLAFTLPGAQPGDEVAVAWVDSRGERRRQAASVLAG